MSLPLEILHLKLNESRDSLTPHIYGDVRSDPDKILRNLKIKGFRSSKSKRIEKLHDAMSRVISKNDCFKHSISLSNVLVDTFSIQFVKHPASDGEVFACGDNRDFCKHILYNLVYAITHASDEIVKWKEDKDNVSFTYSNKTRGITIVMKD